jgi:hypothetical protein
MNSYIVESMAMVGCGRVDTEEVAKVVASLSDIEVDTLDAIYNFGLHTTLTPAGSKARASLISSYSDDDIDVMATYVNAYRNCN